MMGLGLVASLLAEAQRAAPPCLLAALAGVAAAGLALVLLAGGAWD